MGKKETIREQISIFRVEIIDKLDRQEKSFNFYRDQIIKNTTCLNGIKKESLPPIRKAIYALYGLVGTGLIALVIVLIRELIKRTS